MHKATRQDRSILHSLSYSQMDKAKHTEKLGKTKVPAFQYYGNVISRLSTQWPSSERLKGREQAQGFLKRQDIHKTPVPRGTDVIPCPLLSMGFYHYDPWSSGWVLPMESHEDQRDSQRPGSLLLGHPGLLASWQKVPRQLLSTNLVLALVLPCSWCCYSH